MVDDTRGGVSIGDIEDARLRISLLAVRTPLKPSQTLSSRLGKQVYLKLETMQPTGAFKLRGAANAILSLSSAQRKLGVVTCSAGNHGRAVAYVTRHVGIPATVFLSSLVPANKVQAIRELGATVVVTGADFDEASAEAREFCADQGMTFVHAFDDREIVAGQGTIGLEILDDLPNVDTIIVPLSGGGLIAGIALAAKARKPSVHIIGVSMEHGAAMHESLKAGRPVSVKEEPTLADALAGGIELDNSVTFPLVRDLVDEVRLLSEAEIADAMVFALLEERIVLEGAGATPLALLLRDDGAVRGDNIVAVCTGDNVDMTKLLALVQERAG